MSAQRRLRTARRRRQQIGSTLSCIRTGALIIEDVLTNPPDHLKRVRIFTLLLNVPKLGEAGVRKVLRESHVEPIEFVGALSQIERLDIITLLPPRARSSLRDPH